MTLSLTSHPVSIQDAADYYGVSTKTVRRWISAKLISAERVGPRLIRVDISSMKSTPLQGGDSQSWAGN